MKAIQTKYLGATNTKGSRVKATDGDGNSVILGWDSALNHDENHWRAALELCRKMGWTGQLVRGEILRGGKTMGEIFVWSYDGSGRAV